MDISFTTTLCLAFEKIINKVLRYDPASLAQCANLKGPVAIRCHQPELTLYCSGCDDGVQLSAVCSEEPRVTLDGKAIDFIKLLKRPASLNELNIHISGNASDLQAWQDLVKQLDIDWEEAWSDVFGETVGPAIAKFSSSGFTWAASQLQEKRRLFREFLTEEFPIFSNQAESEYLHHKIQDLTIEVERLNEKIDKITKNPNTNTSEDPLR